MNISTHYSACYPTFSIRDCDWFVTSPSDAAAAKAVYAALLILLTSSAGTIIGGFMTRLTHIGLGWNIMIEGAAGALLGTALQFVLWVGSLVFDGASPYPTWLSMLFWTLPFVLTTRAHFMAFTIVLLPINSSEESTIPARVRLWSLTVTLLGFGAVAAMCAVVYLYSASHIVNFIFTAWLGCVGLVLVIMAAKTIIKLKRRREMLGQSHQLKRILSWATCCLFSTSTWVLTLMVRLILIGVLGDPSKLPQLSLPAVMWLLWPIFDTLWLSAANAMMGYLVQSDEITDYTSPLVLPSAVINMGDVNKGHKATGIFLETFTEEEVQLTLATEMPIWKHMPQSWSELISWPHPVNEVQNRMHSAVNALIHFPIVLLTVNYTPFQYYILVPFISTFLRFAFAYRFDPQAWIVLYLSKLFEPEWGAGPPKRFAAAISSVLQAVTVGLIFGGYKVLASWLLAFHMILSLNQMAGFCLGCAMFFLGTKMGLVPAEVCDQCLQKFVKTRKELSDVNHRAKHSYAHSTQSRTKTNTSSSVVEADNT